MKKIYLILALAMISVMSWATVSISVTPNVIDFGTLTLDEEGEAEANATAMLTWSGLRPYCSVLIDTIGAPDASADYEFWALSEDGYDYWYGGDMYNPATNPTVYVGVYAIAPGDYTIKYSFYSYVDEDWEVKSQGVELTLQAKVVDRTTALEGVQSSVVNNKKIMRNGQMYILRNGEKYTATGARVQ